MSGHAHRVPTRNRTDQQARVVAAPRPHILGAVLMALLSRVPYALDENVVSFMADRLPAARANAYVCGMQTYGQLGLGPAPAVLNRAFFHL